MIRTILQPFKNITLKIHNEKTVGDKQVNVGTDEGMTDKSRVGKTGQAFKYKVGPDSIMLKNSALYSPICMKIDGSGEGVLASDGTKPVIGVILETFTQPDKAHEVMVEGIVPMQASAVINAGDLVMAAKAATGDNVNTFRTRIAKATSTNYAFGIALQKASAEGDWISVLIGTTGGKL